MYAQQDFPAVDNVCTRLCGRYSKQMLGKSCLKFNEETQVAFADMAKIGDVVCMPSRIFFPLTMYVPEDEGPYLLMIVGKAFELVDGLAP